MEMHEQDAPRRPNPRRRKRSKLQIFKEAYLPTIILAITAILIFTFIIGGAVQNGGSNETQPPETQAPSSTVTTQDPAQLALEQEAKRLLAEAEAKAKDYDFAGAMAVLDVFSGNISNFPDMVKAYTDYEAAKNDLVPWTASQIPNLSFHVLIADPDRAYADRSLGSNYKKNFITVTEFSNILQQLYDNGYVLVGLKDVYLTEFSESTGRDVFKENTLYLPSSKKPIMITEINASYYTYMVDGNGDGKPDKDGAGFASKLCYDGGKFYNEYVTADGEAVTGSYDMVPLLEDFIAENPDFSYRGGRATIAFTGYDGILGYRTNSNKLSAEDRLKEQEGASAVADALRRAGYTLASYSYANINYATNSASQIQADLQKWVDNVSPIIGALDVMVFARDSDIGDDTPYNSSKFTLLYNAGFRYFMGVSMDSWTQTTDLYVRHDRLMLTGDNFSKKPELYAGLFDVEAILDPARKK